MSNAAEAIAACIAGHRYRTTSEATLQEGIAKVLTAGGFHAIRHERLSARDVPDFMVDDVAIEVKIGGPLASLTRQLFRYAAHDRVQALVVVVTKRSLAALPPTVLGKPVVVVDLILSAL